MKIETINMQISDLEKKIVCLKKERDDLVKNGETEGSIAREIIANHYGVTVDQILSPSRKDLYVKCRGVLVYYLCANHADYGSKEIGLLIDRDRSNTYNLLKKQRAALSTYEKDREDYRSIERKIFERINGAK